MKVHQMNKCRKSSGILQDLECDCILIVVECYVGACVVYFRSYLR